MTRSTFFVALLSLSLLLVSTCLSTTAIAQEASTASASADLLRAPANWKSETIKLPPGFAPKMSFKGTEHVRFAPGMFKANSPSFFSYVFAFELNKGTRLDQAILKKELLTYYRGLARVVLRDDAKGVDFSKFSMELKPAKTSSVKTSSVKANSNATKSADAGSPTTNPEASPEKQTTQPKSPTPPATMVGTLSWIEPFTTKTKQTLNLELQTWSHTKHEVVFVCVSPITIPTTSRGTKPPAVASPTIWQQMRKIRTDYFTLTNPGKPNAKSKTNPQ